MSSFSSELKQLSIENGSVNHYVDDYRYSPPKLLCSSKQHQLTDSRQDAPLCKICVKVAKNYPTELEFREYQTCTDCGVDTYLLMETFYQVSYTVWNTAYPDYSKLKIGLGESRPCIECLEKRLGRTLMASDFIKNHVISRDQSDKIHQRLTAYTSFPL